MDGMVLQWPVEITKYIQALVDRVVMPQKKTEVVTLSSWEVVAWNQDPSIEL